MTVIRGEGRPTTGYRDSSKSRLPSSTTITGHRKAAGLLMWAYNRGLDGKPLYEGEGSRDEAAEIGSIVHQWIEDDLHGDDLTTYMVEESMYRKAEAGYAAYKKWKDQVGLEVLATEMPLVSEVHKFGGTLDCVAKVGGDVVLLDWKTSGGTYPDYIAQIASYRELWNEYGETPLQARVSEAYLLRVGKEFGDFHVHYWTNDILNLGWEWFLAAKKVYEMDKILKSVAS